MTARNSCLLGRLIDVAPGHAAVLEWESAAAGWRSLAQQAEWQDAMQAALAFPGHRHGKVTVAYNTIGDGWTLSVTDDGGGMPHASGAVKPGLGASIVEALANQLEATIDITDMAPGVRVSLSCLRDAHRPNADAASPDLVPA